MRRHVSRQSRLESEARRTKAACVILSAAVTKQVALQVFSVGESLSALITSVRLINCLLMRRLMLLQLVILNKASRAALKIASVRLEPLMTQQMINEVVSHSHSLAAVYALMGCIFLVSSCVTN